VVGCLSADARALGAILDALLHLTGWHLMRHGRFLSE
jgi:hypothetical protein